MTLATAFLAAFGLAACGSSSSSSSPAASSASSSAASSSAATPKLKRIPGAAASGKSAKLVSLKRFAKVAKGASPNIKGLDNVAITQQIPEIAGDINTFWSQEFQKSGATWPSASEALVQSQPDSTQCTNTPTVQPTDPMLICITQQGAVFYWTVPWMQQNIDSDTGGVDLDFNMAEMFSLLVQYQLGTLQQSQQNQIDPGLFWAQNRCLTGVYVASLASRQLLEQNDSNAINSFLQAMATATGISGSSVTSAQIEAAFVTGFKAASPSACTITPQPQTSTGATTSPTSTSAVTTTASTSTGQTGTTPTIPGIGG
jgi:predicted metalloprotease